LNDVSISAAAAVGKSVSDTSLQNVLFTRNEVARGFEGLYVNGGVSYLGSFDSANTRGVRILNNYFHDISDASIGIVGAETVGGAGTNSDIRDITIAGNRIAAHGWGIGTWGGEAFAAARAQAGTVRNLSIVDNDIVGEGAAVPGDLPWCIVLEAGRSDFAATAPDNAISNVQITGNRMTNCPQAGIAVHAADPLLTGNVANDNLVSRVSITRNEVTDSTVGIALRAVHLQASGGTANGNTVRDVDLARLL
jgi:hypothetical protein